MNHIHENENLNEKIIDLNKYQIYKSSYIQNFRDKQNDVFSLEKELKNQISKTCEIKSLNSNINESEAKISFL